MVDGVAAARERGHDVLACQPVAAEAHLAFAAVADLVDPVLIAVDDWQWLDTASARVLGFLLRRLGDDRVRVLVTARTGSAAPLARDLGEDRLTRLALAPLTLAALHELLEARAGISLPRPTLLKIQAAAGGNVVFALEIARVLAERREPLSPGAHPPVPATLNELVAQRVAALPPSTRDMLLAAAALAQPTAGLLSALDGRDPRVVLAPAEDAELVVLRGDRVRFRHPLFAAAVYGDAPPERRRALHRRLARLVTEPETRARHLALAAAGPSRDVADSLAAAARTARDRGAPDAAAEQLEMAAAAIPPHEHDVRRRRLVDAAERVAVNLDLAYVAHARERVPVAAEQARTALVAAEEHGEPGVLAEALAGVAVLDFMLGHGLDEPSLTRALAMEGITRRTPAPMRPSAIHGALMS